MDCQHFSTAIVCYTDAGGVKTSLVAHYEYRNAASGEAQLHAVRYTTSEGVPVDTSAGTVEVGACSVSLGTIFGGGTQIAGPVRATTPAFNGALDTFDAASVAAVPNLLHSITVSARAVTDGLPGQTLNQVVVDASDGSTFALMNNETRTFSVERGQDELLALTYAIRATGNAYATITYTVYTP